MIKEKSKLSIKSTSTKNSANTTKIKSIFPGKPNPLKYDTLKYTSSIPPISESLARDLDEALFEAHKPKSKKYTSKEIFDALGL